jgi:SAM-dependent methyltransferase
MSTSLVNPDTESWTEYYEKLDKYYRLPSTRLACMAMSHMKSPAHNRTVLELGSGSCIDTRYFLEDCGFGHVTSVDCSPTAAEYSSRLMSRFGMRYTHHTCRFDEFFEQYRGQSFDMVHSSTSIFIHGPKGFTRLLQRILHTIRPNGIFSCTFLGPHDEYAKSKAYIFLDLQSAERMISTECQIMYSHQGEHEERLITDRHCHVITIIARKRS